MHHNHSLTVLGLIVLMTFAVGCSGVAPVDGAVKDAGSTPVDATLTDAGIEPNSVDAAFEHRLVPSLKSRVKFKGATRIGTDLSRALSLPGDALCNELGLYNCLSVHQIVLGGMEPYRLGINRPLPKAGLTAPIAADRIALAACAERARLELESEAMPILFEQKPDAGETPSLTWRNAVINELYKRILSRDAEAAEQMMLTAFFDEVVLEHGESSDEALRDWLTLSCFSIATTLEALFY